MQIPLAVRQDLPTLSELNAKAILEIAYPFMHDANRCTVAVVVVVAGTEVKSIYQADLLSFPAEWRVVILAKLWSMMTHDHLYPTHHIVRTTEFIDQLKAFTIAVMDDPVIKNAKLASDSVPFRASVFLESVKNETFRMSEDTIFFEQYEQWGALPVKQPFRAIEPPSSKRRRITPSSTASSTTADASTIAAPAVAHPKAAPDARQTFNKWLDKVCQERDTLKAEKAEVMMTVERMRLENQQMKQQMDELVKVNAKVKAFCNDVLASVQTETKKTEEE